MSSYKYQNISDGIIVTSNNLKIKSYKLRVISKRFSKLFTFHLLLVTCYLLLSISLSSSAEITGPEVKLQDNEIYVTTALSLDENHIQELRNGIAKEFRFYIDIFRLWKMWPDEFVLGKLFVRTLKCDPVKTEYLSTSSDGSTLIEKRFKSFESMVRWAVSINDLKLVNTRELEPGVYFVRVTVESKIRKLPPVIGYFMIFLSENEFKIKKDSSPFNIGPAK
ncbi:MAG: DUF4390 domain-containing protein [Nitrospirota bacterium]|nr:DUF4390 domain-containing protein [Nitrospirota bacterium]